MLLLAQSKYRQTDFLKFKATAWWKARNTYLTVWIQLSVAECASLLIIQRVSYRELTITITISKGFNALLVMAGFLGWAYWHLALK